MQERGKGMDTREARPFKREGENDAPSIWSSLSVLAVAMAAGGILARLEAGPRYDWLLLMTAMGLTAAVLMRLLADNTAEREAQAKHDAEAAVQQVDWKKQKPQSLPRRRELREQT